MKPRTGVEVILPVLLIVLAATGLASGRQAQPPAFKSGVDLVTVDLTVLNRSGEPVADLKPSDLTVLVDGRPRRIVSLRLVRADAGDIELQAAPPPEIKALLPPVPPGHGRRFVLAVDRDNITRGEGQQMLSAGARFIDDMGPADRAAVWAIPATGSRLQFTVDRDGLKQQLRRMVGTEPPPFGKWVVANEEAIQIDDGDPKVLGEVIARECYKQPQTCPDEVEMQARTLGKDLRQRTFTTMTDVEALIDSLAAMEGPKQLIWITCGPPQLPEYMTDMSRLGAKADAARVTVHALQLAVAPSQARADSMRATPVQTDQTHSLSYAIAGMTGGMTITTPNGTVAFTRLARELSASYLLAIETVEADRDGKPHAIDVKVADRGWGVSVRARKSFTIDRAAPAAAPAAPAAPAAGAAPSEPGAAPPTPASPAPGPAGPVGIDVAEVSARLADYVARFEAGVTAVVAEERYVQITHPWRGNPKGPEAEPALRWFDNPADPQLRKGGPIIARRQLLSDVLFVQVGGKQWVGYRDVAEVDGKLVRDRTERVKDLFLSAAPDREAQFQRITAESARYNLGDFRRTLNIPTVTLSFMHRLHQWRFEYKRASDEKIDGRVVRVLTFKEKVRPTLIGTPGGAEIPIEGRIWIEAATGNVVRTELRFDRGGERRCLIRTDFGPLEGASVLVPALMWEWYEGADQIGRIGGDKTLVQCVATYSAYRRFQVSTTEQIK